MRWDRKERPRWTRTLDVQLRCSVFRKSTDHCFLEGRSRTGFSLTFELELGPSWRTLFLRREDSVRKTQVFTFVHPIVDAR